MSYSSGAQRYIVKVLGTQFGLRAEQVEEFLGDERTYQAIDDFLKGKETVPKLLFFYQMRDSFTEEGEFIEAPGAWSRRSVAPPPAHTPFPCSATLSSPPFPPHRRQPRDHAPSARAAAVAAAHWPSRVAAAAATTARGGDGRGAHALGRAPPAADAHGASGARARDTWPLAREGDTPPCRRLRRHRPRSRAAARSLGSQTS